LTEAPTVESARASKEVPMCRSYGAECRMWSDYGIVLGSRARWEYGETRETGGDARRGDTRAILGRCGDERMKRRGNSTGFVSMTSSNSEPNPATQHAGGAGTDRKDGEGGYEALRNGCGECGSERSSRARRVCTQWHRSVPEAQCGWKRARH
jgi:hypothetical protein